MQRRKLAREFELEAGRLVNDFVRWAEAHKGIELACDPGPEMLVSTSRQSFSRQQSSLISRKPPQRPGV